MDRCKYKVAFTQNSNAVVWKENDNLAGTSNVRGIYSSPQGISQSVRAAIDRSFGVTFPSRNNPPSLSSLPPSPSPIAPQIVLWLHFRARNWPRGANIPAITHYHSLPCIKDVLMLYGTHGKLLKNILIPGHEFIS